MSEANSQSQTSLSRSRSVSQAGGVYEGETDGGGGDDYFSLTDDYPDLRQETPSQEEEEEEQEEPDEEPGEELEEVEEGEENLAVPTQPKYEPCPEDDDFLAALDKMVNENIAESKNVGWYRVPPSQQLTD